MGFPVACGGRENGRYWVRIQGVATYRYSVGEPEAWAIPSFGVSDDTVRDSFFRSVLPLFLHARGDEALHASAVRGKRGVVAFCARSGTGKSTIAYALGLRGYPVWADDAVACTLSPGQVRALPLPFRVRVSPASRRLLAGNRVVPFVRREAQDIVCASSAPAPLAALCVLERDEGRAEPRLAELRPPEAFAALLPHAYAFSLRDTARRQQTVQHYLQLVEHVPVYALRFAGGREHLARVLDTLECQLGLQAPETE